MIVRSFGFALALGLAFLAGTLVPTASTQSNETQPATTKRYNPPSTTQSPSPRRYLQVQYMKVHPGKGVAYRRLERELWKPVHQERVNRGLIISWGLYGVHLPGGSVDYDYAVLTEFPSFAALENSQYPELFAEVQGMDDYEAVLRQTNEARERIRQDIWVMVEHTD